MSPFTESNWEAFSGTVQVRMGSWGWGGNVCPDSELPLRAGTGLGKSGPNECSDLRAASQSSDLQIFKRVSVWTFVRGRAGQGENGSGEEQRVGEIVDALDLERDGLLG